MVINLILIGVLFKNYKNIALKQFIISALVNIALDNFVVRPIASIIFGLILSRSQNIVNFITEEEKDVQLVEMYEKMNGQEMLEKPIGKMFSPSKLAKCVPVANL